MYDIMFWTTGAFSLRAHRTQPIARSRGVTPRGFGPSLPILYRLVSYNYASSSLFGGSQRLDLFFSLEVCLSGLELLTLRLQLGDLGRQ